MCLYPPNINEWMKKNRKKLNEKGKENKKIKIHSTHNAHKESEKNMWNDEMLVKMAYIQQMVYVLFFYVCADHRFDFRFCGGSALSSVNSNDVQRDVRHWKNLLFSVLIHILFCLKFYISLCRCVLSLPNIKFFFLNRQWKCI